jgi:asparagine synthetase B (glutamine-hydrolysing)
MGGILIAAGDVRATEREARIRAMASRSTYRGGLQACVSSGHLTVGVQARSAEASAHIDEALLVAVHGYVYRPGVGAGGAEQSPAALLAERWSARGVDALGEIDGEFSAVIQDRQRGIAWLCNSLSGTRPIYWCSAPDLLIGASEIRQVAVGARLPLRLEPAGLVELLSFHGVRVDRERTEFRGVDRLAAPGVYRIDPLKRRLRPDGQYWAPPPTERLKRADRAGLPERTAHTLTQALASIPDGGKFALSGGYDSGLLWILANRCLPERPPPEAYALIFPGLAADERPTIRALLRQTDSSAHFLPADQVKPSESIDDAVDAVDRLLAAPTFTNLEVLARATAAGGGAGIINGLGAEVSLEATETYAADLLRRGRWHQLLLDAPRFRPYIANEPGSIGARLRYFGKVAIAPPGSWLRRRRAPTRPRWLHPRWHDHWRAGVAELTPTDAGAGGYARAERMGLLRSLGNVATENYEQICQRHGLEAYHPYFHRSALDLGFRIPARESNRGLHTKQLLRDAARWALDGRQPPWPQEKVIFDSLVAQDHDLVLALGPARRWGLVESGVLDPDAAGDLAARLARREPVQPLDTVLAIAERYWRRYA